MSKLTTRTGTSKFALPLPEGIEVSIFANNFKNPISFDQFGKLILPNKDLKVEAFLIGIEFFDTMQGHAFCYNVEKHGDKITSVGTVGGYELASIPLKKVQDTLFGKAITRLEPAKYPDNGMRIAHIKEENETDIYQIGIVSFKGEIHLVCDKTYSDIVFFKDMNGATICDELPGRKWESLRGIFAGHFAHKGITLKVKPYVRKDKPGLPVPRNEGELVIVFHNLLMGYAIAQGRLKGGRIASMMIPKDQLPETNSKMPVAMKKGTICSFRHITLPDENSKTVCDYIAIGLRIESK